MMSPEIAPIPPKSPDLLDIKLLTPEQKTLFKPLISPAIKHVLVSKLNNITGGKIRCIRNWQERSGKALLQKINDTFSPVLSRKLQSQKTNLPVKFSGAVRRAITNKTCESVGSIADGALQVVGVKSFGEKFINVSYDILSQTGNDVPPQTINRLITIVGVAYSENNNVRTIIDKTKENFLEEVFKKDGILSKELNKKLGSFAKPVEKLIAVLGIKGTVDDFLTERVLQDKSAEKVLVYGDVYDKLILKGVSHFIDIRSGKNLTLDDLLNDKALDPKIREQLVELQKLHKGMPGKITETLKPKALTDKILTRLKDKDILRMSREELKGVLRGAVNDYEVELKTEFGNKVERLVTHLEDAGTAIMGVFKKPLVNICESGKKVIHQVASCARGIFNWVWGNSETESKEELDKNPGSPEPTKSEQEIEEASAEVITETENKNGEVAKEEKELEEDFGEYLQNLFAEESEGTSKEEPSKIPTENTEQNTGIGSMVLDKTTDALALGLKGVGKTIETVAPAIELTGKGVWWAGEKLVGFGKWMIGSSPKNEPETSSPETKEENKAEAAKSEETLIPEQQNLPQETEETAIQPNVVEDTQQTTFTTESEKPEDNAPIMGSEATPKTQGNVPPSEIKENSEESPVAVPAEESTKKPEDNRWFYQRWWDYWTGK